MKIFFDCEMTGLFKTANLISIGLISEDGKGFYAEFTDYDNFLLNQWIRENVIANLLFNGQKNDEMKKILNKHGIVSIKGNRQSIGDALRQWLSQFESVLYASDCSHYDFVLIIDLLYKTALDIPMNHSKVCHDINYDIANHKSVDIVTAFDISRESLVPSTSPGMIRYKDLIKAMNKHNSLYDAIIAREIYNICG